MKGIVPGGVCTPGSATCLSKYNLIVSGNPSGSSVGVVSSLGKSYWYAYSAPPPPPASYLSAWLGASVTTSGKNLYSSSGLALTLSANTAYAFYAFTSIEPFFGTESYDFEIHALPPGASLVIACSPMAYPLGGGSQPTGCVTTPGTPIAQSGALVFGTAPPVYGTPGVFGLVRVGGAGGTLQIDFACLSNCGGVSMVAGSYILAYAVA